MRKFGILLTIGLFILMFFAFSITNYASENEAVILFRDGKYVAYYADKEIASQTSLDRLLDSISAPCVRLNSLTVNEPVTVRRDVTILGSITAYCDLIITEGADVRLDNHTINLRSHASLRVTGGSLTLDNAYIMADSMAIRLEESDSSLVVINSGECISLSSHALEITRGAANLVGGSIQGNAKSAIINAAELNLSLGVKIKGQAYQVKSTGAVHSIDGTLPEDFTLMLERTFPEGEMYTAITGVTDYRGDVRIFDGNGKEESIKLFESYGDVTEKNFIAVYKPYKIDLIVDGVKDSVYALAGEKIDTRTLPDKAGYSPKGWFTDSTLLEKYDFSSPVTSSFSLYAGYSLLPPEFVLKDLHAEYNGAPTVISFESLTHPLLDSGIISYQWYNSSGKQVSVRESLTLNGVSDSGEYYCRISFSHGRETVETVTPKVSVSVVRGIVKVPDIPSLVYNGGMQYPILPYSELYTADVQGHVDVGTYTITLTLLDADNYRWEDVNGKSATVSFDILPELPVSISVLNTPTVTSYSAFDFFNGEGMTLSVLYNSGRRAEIDASQAEFYYQSGDCFLYTDNAVIVEYMDCRTLQPVTVSRIDYTHSVSLTSASFTYNGKYQTLTPVGEFPVGEDGISLCYRIIGGGTDIGEYPIKLEFFSDSTNYNIPEPIYATLTVIPLTCKVVWSTDKIVYDGEIKCPEAYFINEYGTKIPLFAKGGGIYAGSGYTATVSSPSENYIFENVTREFTIEKATFDLTGVVWSELSYVYDGNPKAPYLLNLPEGLTVKEYIGVGESEVGEYTIGVVFEYDTENYNAPLLPDAVMVIKEPFSLFGKDKAHVYVFISLSMLLLGLMTFVLVKRREALVAYFKGIRAANKPQPHINSSDNIANVGSILSVNADRADEFISNSLARTLIRKSLIPINTGGTRRGVINLDTISEAFEAGSIVDINSLKDKGLIDENVCYVKVLARGTLDKPLKIFANSFSLSAVKMIALTGGEVNKIQSKRLK